MNNDIIAAGPLVEGNGVTVAHRPVLRRMNGTYVVHTQCVESNGNVFFTSGDYFAFDPNEREAFTKARDRWLQRVGEDVCYPPAPAERYAMLEAAAAKKAA